MDKQFLEKIRARLLADRHAVLHEAAGAVQGRHTLEEERYPDIADESANFRNREILERLSAEGRRQVEEIDAALGRIGTGEYGACVSCGEAIPPARLEAYPMARRCITCQADWERERPNGASHPEEVLAGEEAEADE